MTVCPRLQQVTRALAHRISVLEQDVVQQERLGNRQQALYAAHTAAEFRQFLAEFIGPTWHALADSGWPTSVAHPAQPTCTTDSLEAS